MHHHADVVTDPKHAISYVTLEKRSRRRPNLRSYPHAASDLVSRPRDFSTKKVMAGNHADNGGGGVGHGREWGALKRSCFFLPTGGLTIDLFRSRA